MLKIRGEIVRRLRDLSTLAVAGPGHCTALLCALPCI